MPAPSRTLALLLASASLLPALALSAQPPAATKPSDEQKQAQEKTAVKEAAKPDETAPAKKAEAPAAAAKSDPIAKIREEGMERSHVMETLSYLTDVIGPRLTNSPQMKHANEWTRDQMASWGLENAHLEAWGPFGKGWSLTKFSAQVVEPQCFPLVAYPKAWTPGVEGTVVGEVVHFDPKTVAEMDAYKGKLKGAIVLLGGPVDVNARFEPLATRMNDTDLLRLADSGEGGSFLFSSGRSGPGASTKGAATKGAASKSETSTPAKGAATPSRRGGPDSPGMRERLELFRKRSEFLMNEGAAALLEPSPQGDGGTLFVSSASVPGSSPMPGAGRRISAWDKETPKLLPQVVVAKEHYNRLVRMIQQGVKPKLALELGVKFHDEDLMGYNTVAEIPGSDLKDEVVMLGGHMDSWHSGTGATDNAAGVAVAMEAARVIKALGLKPRRTIRVALWSGEEQGLLGSRAYVTQHFGKAPPSFFGAPPTETTKDKKPSGPTPEFEHFSAYYNLDNGTGKIRGIFLQGNEAVRPIFRKWLAPFRDLDASTITIANTGSTDHVSFDAIGLPGFQFIQDPVEYNTRTHHSSQDVYDRIQADDMKQASTIMAAFVYNTAMMDEKIPRKPSSR